MTSDATTTVTAGVARDGWNLLKALQRASVLAEKMFSQSNFSKNRSLAVPFTNYQRPNSANDSSVTNRLWWINYHNKPQHIKPLWSWHGFSLTELRQNSELKGRNQSNVHQTVSSSNRLMLYMSTKSYCTENIRKGFVLMCQRIYHCERTVCADARNGHRFYACYLTKESNTHNDSRETAAHIITDPPPPCCI